MHSAAELARVLQTVSLVAVHGPWSRVVGFRHLIGPPGSARPLWGGAAELYGGRFTPKGGFDSIYLAWDPVTALSEVQAVVLLPGGPTTLVSAPWGIVSVDGVVSNVLDLSNLATIAALGSSESEVIGPWAGVSNPPTQLLAQEAWLSGLISGIKYRSSKNLPAGLNLVVFPDRLSISPRDYLEVYDPYGHLTQRVPPK
jgi:RES domain-containing protein